MRILLIEDCSIAARAIELVLTGARFNVEHSATGEEGIDLAKVYEFDLILLDLALPDISGIEVLRRLRLAHIDTPVLILTGSDDTEVKLRGFGSGADDYMTKPFHQQELLARIKAIVRRINGHAQALIRAGDLVINLNAGSAEVHGKKLMLSVKEYQVLELLALRKGTTLTKETFLNHIYGGLDEPDLTIIDVLICKLRKKLADALGGKSLVETVWGRGYVLRDPDTASNGGFAASA